MDEAHITHEVAALREIQGTMAEIGTRMGLTPEQLYPLAMLGAIYTSNNLLYDLLHYAKAEHALHHDPQVRAMWESQQWLMNKMRQDLGTDEPWKAPDVEPPPP